MAGQFECYSRIEAILHALQAASLFRGSIPNPEVREIKSAQPASMADISLVHKKEYVEQLREVVRETSETRGIADLDTPDELTYVTAHTLDDALLAAGTTLGSGGRRLGTSREGSGGAWGSGAPVGIAIWFGPLGTMRWP
eukprot:jgi/Botrbrau1/9438/Bobra.0252s0061.1